MSKFHLYYFGCLAGLTLLPLAQAATDCSTVTQISPTECEVLLDFYNSTGGANWRDNTGWNETNTPCEWKGVSCNDGQVISLVLEDNGLSGVIPNSLGNLTHLQGLYLNDNQLSGSIPDSLGQLGVLQMLSLRSNQLSGPIPDSLGYLSNLQSFDLRYNQLNGSIPDSLGYLSNLQRLGLGRNQLSGTIPDSLGKLSNLQVLILDDNQLNGAIPNWLGNLSNLRTLSLEKIQLSGSIPDSLSNLSNLQWLYLSGNQLSGSIPDSLGNLGNLQVLHLSSNELCGDIPFSLMNLKELSGSLDNNHLTASDPNLISWLNHFDPNWASTQTPCPQAQTCLVYALHQDGLNNTQFVTITPRLNFQINPLGNPHSGYNIEDIDILSATNELYAASGDNPASDLDQGYLYQINRDNGELIPVCSTGLSEITALSFHPTDNKLWVWSNGNGLFVIDINSIANGLCHQTEVLHYPTIVTDLTWDNVGQILYGLVGTTLYKYSSNTGAVEIACDNLPADVTALDALADGSLLLAGHNANENHISSFDSNTCSVIAQVPLVTDNYSGIEGITWRCYFE